MSLLETIKKIFDENGINYFQGNNDNRNIINVPYRGITDPKDRIEIYLEIDEFLKSIKFFFNEKCNKNMEITEIKSQLLDINANLQSGSLSMRNDSDSIEYRIDYPVFDDVFSFKQYNINIVNCVKVYEMLKGKELIL